MDSRTACNSEDSKTEIAGSKIANRASVEWLSLALESAKMQAYLWDLKTNVILRSDQSSVETRIDSDHDSWTYLEGTEYAHPDDLQAIQEQINQAIKTHDDFRLEYRIRTSTGEIRWRLAKGRPIYNKQGEATHVFSVTQDITERKEDELLLKKQKRELEIAKQQLTFTLDAAGIFAVTNLQLGYKMRCPELCRIFGIEDENTELDQEFLRSRIHPDDRERMRGEVESNILHGGLFEHEYRVVLPSGEVRWLFAKGTRTFESGVFATVQDLTSRKEMEQQIIQKNHELELARKKVEETSNILNSIMATSVDNIYVKDRSGRIVYCNPITLKRIGKTEDDLYGKNDVEFLGPGNGGEEILRTDEWIMNTGAGKSVEEWITWCDGARRLYLSEKAPQRDASGNIIGLIGISRDITERKNIEEQIKRKNQELSRVNEKLKRFAAIVAHDLKNPLASMSMGADLLNRAKSMIEVDKRSKVIKDIADRMANLIDELLLFASSETEEVKIKEPVRIHDLMNIVKSNLASAIRQSHAKVEISNNLPEVFGNPILLLQLFQNLIANGIKFQSERSPILKVTSQDAGTQIVITISDNGLGISAANVSEVFEPFRRFHSNIQGNGLGLSICKKIVEQHGGEIWVESKMGIGSQFSFTLPKGKPGSDI